MCITSPEGFSTIDYVIGLSGGLSYTTIGWNRSCDVTEGTMCLSICCREDGLDGRLVSLPTASPFVMLKVMSYIAKSLVSYTLISKPKQNIMYQVTHILIMVSSGSTLITMTIQLDIYMADITTNTSNIKREEESHF